MKGILAGLILLLVPAMLGAEPMTPIHAKHLNLDEVDQEFTNLFLNAQGKEFTVFSGTTPSANLQIGRITFDTTGGTATVKLCTAIDRTTYTWCVTMTKQ